MDDWDRIVREHGRMVFGTAWRILGHVADTEDVVQEVFVEALRQGSGVRSWGGLLRCLATCRALDRLRRRRPEQSLDGLALESPDDDPESVAIGRETAEQLRQAVARLPEREAEIFCLRYFENLSNQRIAEILNVRPNTVSVALHKARTRLEAVLTEAVKGE